MKMYLDARYECVDGDNDLTHISDYGVTFLKSIGVPIAIDEDTGEAVFEDIYAWIDEDYYVQFYEWMLMEHPEKFKLVKVAGPYTD